ncbi:hypothetical protein GCM10020254_47690 [Streptomyces goshikiensis]
MGWITDTYGARIGMATGGLISLAGALTIAVILSRVGNLRLRVSRHHGLALVPRTPTLARAA